MNQSFDKEGRQFAWDATSLELAMECPRKYFYVMRKGWRKRAPNVHLFFGGLIASAFEHYHKRRILEGKSHDQALEGVVMEALEATWIDGAPWHSDHNAKTRENLIRTIVWYLEEFKDDPLRTVVLKNGEPAVEQSFRLPVSDDVIFCGHLDRLVEQDGDQYATDNKTTGYTITDQFFRQFDLSCQMSMYTFAGKAILSSPIKGVIIDAAQIAVGFSRFVRGYTFRTKSQLDDWFRDTMHWIKIIWRYAELDSEHGEDENHWPKNTTSCDRYSGCQFRAICAQSPENRLQFLKADFEQQPTWDPMTPR